MRSFKKILCLLITLMLIIPFASPVKGVFAEEDMPRVYTSAEGAPEGSYYIEFDDYYDTLHYKRYQEGYLLLDMSEDEALSYADEMAPKDLAVFKASPWYYDPEECLIIAEFPGDYDCSNIFSFESDSMDLFDMIGLKDTGSVTWIPVAIPKTEYDVFDHGQWYLNLNQVYEDFFMEAYDFYTSHPEYTEDWDDERLMYECQSYAMSYVDFMRQGELYIDPDDVLFRVKMCITDSEGETETLYFPKDAVFSLPDVSEYVIPYHDYYWIQSWNWESPDKATVTVLCYLGEQDGTGDVLIDEVTDITKVVIREASELTDGIIECTGRYDCQGSVYTDVHTFYIPATGDPERVTITRQPESVTVNYPEGSSFSVEVDREDLVDSYQWIMGDGVKEYVLDGITANNAALECPSTAMYMEYTYYYCIITDINGNVTVSDKAGQTVENFSERKVVLYVGDYAVEPGETLDLSDTPLGSGIVTFDDDGQHITLDSIHVTASKRSLDKALGAGGMGIFLQGETYYDSEYYMYFKGECVLTDDYYDEERDQGGVALNADLASSASEDRGTLYIDGDGDLLLIGGTYSIYTDGYLEICSDFKSVPYEGHNNNGIASENLVIHEGVHADISCIGTGILTTQTLFVRDKAVVDIDAVAPRFYGQDTDVKGIYCMDLYCGAADLNINIHGHADDFVPYDRNLASASGIKCNASVDFTGTKVNIRMDADESEYLYAYNFAGITGEPLYGVAMTEGAELNIDISSKSIYASKAIFAQGSDVYPEYTSGAISLKDGSVLNISTYTSGHTTGIEVSKPVSVEDSTLKVDVKSYDTAIVIGVDAPEFDVDLTDSRYSALVNAENGSALIICDTDKVTDTEFSEDYEPKLIHINDEAKILIPDDGVISCYGFDPWRSITPIETVLSKSDPEMAASRVLIAVPKDPAPSTGDSIYLWSAVMAVCIGAAVILIRKYRQTAKVYGK